MLDRFIQILRHAGLEPTAVEVAEMLLLASLIPEPAEAGKAEAQSTKESSKPPTPAPLDNRSKQEGGTPDRRNQAESDSEQNSGGALFPENDDEPYIGEQAIQALPFRTPKAPALPGAQRIANSLRPLRRAFPSHHLFVLDEEKTVQQIADGGPKSPVMKPESERWLDVALVFDESLTMQVWRPTLKAIQQLFERSGIFRNVKSWILNTENEFPTLHLASRVWQSSQYRSSGKTAEIRSPRELMDTSGRRLILVVSDCYSPAWFKGEAYRLLAKWGANMPVALAQILPQRFWPGTTMTPVDAWLRAYLPGTSNRRLEINPPWYREVIKAGGIPIPVVSLEEWAIAPWAKMVAGASGVTTLGLIIPPLPEKRSAENLESQTRRQPEPRTKQNDENDSQEAEALTREPLQPSPKQRLDEFFTNATPMARQLTHYLASVPLTLPIIQLVQQAMLPQARQSHLAEFVLGGLVYTVKPKSPGRQNANEIAFEFHDGVRDELINRITKFETVMVIATVSHYIEQRLEEGQGGEFGARVGLPTGTPTGAARGIDPLSRQFEHSYPAAFRRLR
jgi:hypothetical protein